TGNNAINMTSGTTATTLSGGGGDDTFTLTNLTGITVAVTINGDASTSGDAIVLDDSAASGADSYAGTSGTVTRGGGFGGLTYATTESLNLKAETGNNAINLNSGGIAVTISGGSGDDTITLTSLGGITGAVTVSGDAHTIRDTIILDDSAAAGTDSYT